ncbi:MAG: DUF721 domain-containing protein [Elusimicrobia bacterium]|nr:DUF721 domain-containing protein [Elusimicrobiota bacterium]
MRRVGDLIRQWWGERQTDTESLSLLRSAWDLEMGHLKGHVSLHGIRSRVLFVKVSSPSAEQEVAFRKTEILRNLNKRLGRNALTDLKVNRWPEEK